MECYKLEGRWDAGGRGHGSGALKILPQKFDAPMMLTSAVYIEYFIKNHLIT